MPHLKVPTGVGRSEFIEKKSRFIGEARAVHHADEAKETVSRLRLEHPRSRHVVWAYIIGSDGALKGLSDDGEPHGTAGRPVLDPIAGSGLTNTLVTVVRYFGGEKLGTGGLVSAYGRCSREALEDMSFEELIPRTRVRLVIDYPIYEPARRMVDDAGGRISGEDFAAGVELAFDVPDAAWGALRQALTDLSRGAAVMESSRNDM